MQDFSRVLNFKKERASSRDVALNSQQDLYLIMDYYPLDFYKLFRSARQGTILDTEHVTILAYNCLVGLKQLHETGIIHRDIKPSNLLLDTSCQVKIADFGLARDVNDRGYSPHVVTRSYRAPEVALLEEYDAGVDVFALGCVLYELMSICLAQQTFKGNANKI